MSDNVVLRAVTKLLADVRALAARVDSAESAAGIAQDATERVNSLQRRVADTSADTEQALTRVRDVSAKLAQVEERVAKLAPARDGKPGRDGRDGQPGAPGKPGEGVTRVEVEPGNRLAVWIGEVKTLAGLITAERGATGKQGPAGPRGPQGPAGRDGRDGADGKSVTDVKVDGRKLYVWIDGVRKLAGELTLPTLGALGGGGGAKTSSPSLVGLRVANGLELTNQVPVGLDVPLQVKFGAESTITGDVVIKSDGRIIAERAGRYQFDMNLNYGRTGTSGTAKMLVRAVVNGVGIPGSGANFFASETDRLTKSTSFGLDMLAGDVLTIEIKRASDGADAGQLFAQADPGGWATVPSASMLIRRLEGL